MFLPMCAQIYGVKVKKNVYWSQNFLRLVRKVTLKVKGTDGSLISVSFSPSLSRALSKWQSSSLTPVILYDGSEEELMDTIEREFSWPDPTRPAVWRCLLVVGCQKKMYTKQNKTRVPGFPLLWTAEGFLFVLNWRCIFRLFLAPAESYLIVSRRCNCRVVKATWNRLWEIVLTAQVSAMTEASFGL